MQRRWAALWAVWMLLPVLLCGVLLAAENAAARSMLTEDRDSSTCVSLASPAGSGADAPLPATSEMRSFDEAHGSLHRARIGRRVRTEVPVIAAWFGVPVEPHWAAPRTIVADPPERPNPSLLAAFCRPPPVTHF
jgi:hypothetical protein